MATSIFVHIPKTGGTSLRQLMTLNYKPEQILSVYGELSSVILQCRVAIHKTKELSLIQGHIPYGTHRFLNIRAPDYYAFLRQPVNKFYSEVQYSITDKRHGFHHYFKDAGDVPETWAGIASEIIYYRNNACHYMGGSFFSQEVGVNGA